MLESRPALMNTTHEPAADYFAVCHAVLAVVMCHVTQLWAVSSPAAAYQ